MFSKKYIIATIAQEQEVIKHLAGKISSAEQLDYRPSENQRSLGELLAYITLMSSNFVQIIKEQKMRPEIFNQNQKEILPNILNDFATLMDEQNTIVAEFLESLDETDLDTSFDAFGMGHPLSVRDYCMFILRQYPAYKMQLFQYLKSGLGMHELGTLNVWMGQDIPTQK